jgi:hypothetical protein
MTKIEELGDKKQVVTSEMTQKELVEAGEKENTYITNNEEGEQVVVYEE